MLALTATVLALSVGAQAKVWTTVYRCDEKTPLTPSDPNYPSVYQDIMVGTQLVIVLSSDSRQPWLGSLQYTPKNGEDMPLTGRGYDLNRDSFADSCLPAAGGDKAAVRLLDLMGMWSLDLMTGAFPSSGDWFILDYRADGVGTYDLGLYDLHISWDTPIQVLSFTQVPSCDFDGNGIVDFEDYALLASHELVAEPILDDQNVAFDLNSDGLIDFRDLASFSGHWLERTMCDMPVDPNQATGP